MSVAAKEELPNLDALRALAVLFVLINHVLAIGARFGWAELRSLDQLGRCGVLLFFVHTCYVLMASLERLPMEGTTLARTFYVRRAFRIYPLSIVCIGLVLLLGVPSLPWETFKPPSVGTLLSNLALTMNLSGSKLMLGQLWTLPIEIQMYLVLPFIFLATRRASDLKRIANFYAMALAAAWILPALAGRLYGAQFGPCFMAGVVAYALRTRVSPLIPAAWWLISLTAASACYVFLEYLIPGAQSPALQIAFCLAVGLGMPCFMQSDARVLNRVTHLLAKYSYGIYLFHLVALWIGFYWVRPASPWLAFSWSLAALVILAIAGYHLVEAPAIRLGVRLSKPRAPAVAETVPPAR